MPPTTMPATGASSVTTMSTVASEQPPRRVAKLRERAAAHHAPEIAERARRRAGCAPSGSCRARSAAARASARPPTCSRRSARRESPQSRRSSRNAVSAHEHAAARCRGRGLPGVVAPRKRIQQLEEEHERGAQAAAPRTSRSGARPAATRASHRARAPRRATPARAAAQARCRRRAASTYGRSDDGQALLERPQLAGPAFAAAVDPR